MQKNNSDIRRLANFNGLEDKLEIEKRIYKISFARGRFSDAREAARRYQRFYKQKLEQDKEWDQMGGNIPAQVSIQSSQIENNNHDLKK